MKKRYCTSQYGSFEMPRPELPNKVFYHQRKKALSRDSYIERDALSAKELFTLRIKALTFDDEFCNFCHQPRILPPPMKDGPTQRR